MALAIVLLYLIINHNHNLLRLLTYYLLIGVIPLFLRAFAILPIGAPAAEVISQSTFQIMMSDFGLLGLFFFLILLFEIIKIIVSFKVAYSEDILKQLSEYGHGESYFKDYGYTTHWYVCFSGSMIATIAWMAMDHLWWTDFSALLLWWFCLGLWLKMMVRLKT